MDDYAPSRFKVLCKIGEGVHGVVMKAIDLSSPGANKLVAIKKVSLRTKHGSIATHTLREIKVLQHCDHENILTLLTIYPDLNGLALVFDFMPHTLQSRLKDETDPLSRQEVKSYTRMLLKGLSYLHEKGIMHRDIKPANLLIDDNGRLKIADFGLARLFTALKTANEEAGVCFSPQVASRWYRAPELLWGSQRYGPPVDMWAVGCVFAEMLRGVPLFPGSTDIEQLALVVRTLGTPHQAEWPEIHHLPDFSKISFPHSKGEKWESIFPSCTTPQEISLVDNLVTYNPRKRLTPDQALHHEYFN
ncbi:cyclin-dependent kinase 20 [Lutzomyia longipalpis]|uniref:cyclin-dependent kinase 20 n=1 Tax=Lutzomyia longipalpis TaxID=7200 RepID=UPI00248359A7|nr:cyclin-dependent kinase 20 [Lutzomyia longipalpis]